jgi:hypothetical protein
MRLSEIALPATAEGMAAFGKVMTDAARKLAAHHGITIDGGATHKIGYLDGGNARLPLARKEFILDGGYLRPLGGIKGEEKRTEPFEKRVKDFLTTLHKGLQKHQVQAINDSLGLDFHIYVGTLRTQDGRGLKRADETTPSDWFDMLTFNKDHRDLPEVHATWMVAK